MLALVTVSMLLLGVRIWPCSGCKWRFSYIPFNEPQNQTTNEEITAVYVGKAGVWGIGKNGNVYHKDGTYNVSGRWHDHTEDFIRPFRSGEGVVALKASLTPLSVGKDVVWGFVRDVNQDKMFYRPISAKNSHGSKWEPVDEEHENTLYEDVTVSPNGSVWAVRKVRTEWNVVFRTGITDQIKGGTGWRTVERKSNMKRLSAGASGLWGVDETGQVWYRVGTYGDTGVSGTSWVKIPDPDPLGSPEKIEHISVGDDFVLIVNEVGRVWKREKISSQDPDGDSWNNVATGMSQVDTWNCYVWGISDSGNVMWAKLGIES